MDGSCLANSRLSVSIAIFNNFGSNVGTASQTTAIPT